MVESRKQQEDCAMTMPPILEQAIARALAAVRSHPAHHLELPYRRAIWAALGPRMEPSQPFGGIGHFRRTRLDAQTVRHVLPRWHAAWPDDSTPGEILDEAERVLRGEFDDADIRKNVGLSWHYMDELSQGANPAGSFAVLAGYAAVKVLDRAWYDLHFDPERIDGPQDDGQVSAYDSDAAFDASMVYANGGLGDPRSDPAKRLEFWEWWLTRAVPAAWVAVPER
jgi:immunity protein Imm5 of predicted polymorphic toxin system